MAHALERLEEGEDVTLEEIEDTMIAFGYEVWPWNQAYREFLAVAEASVGEHFLLPKLPPTLQNKFLDFKAFGGSLRDLHSGSAADYFTSDERVLLCQALVDMQIELRQYVAQEVAGLGRNRYMDRVHEFMKLSKDIQKTLDSLRMLAHNEQDHPTLADEIRSQVRAFEYGLCYLGPELDYEAVCAAPDFFKGRKSELDRMRGIHVPFKANFYAD